MQDFSYNLLTWKCDKVPKLRYIDNPETWNVTFTGRTLKSVSSWRAAIETSRQGGMPRVIARIDDGLSLTDATLTFPADCFFYLFRDAVRNFDSGRKLNFALYGLDESKKTVEYIEFEILGLPAVDPPGTEPKHLLSPNDYYDANMVNFLFCQSGNADNVYQNGDICTASLSAWIANYNLVLDKDAGDVQIRITGEKADFPATGDFFLNIDKPGTGNVAFSENVKWYETKWGMMTSADPLAAPPIDFSAAGYYHLRFYCEYDEDSQQVSFYNRSEDNEVKLYE